MPPLKEPECATKHFSREVTTSRASQWVKEGLDFEQTFLEETHHILSSLPLFALTKCNAWKRKQKHLLFPIMSLPNKAHVPLVITTQKLQIIRNKGILHISNTKYWTLDSRYKAIILQIICIFVSLLLAIGKFQGPLS
jgi:hypothetical protein